MPSSLALSRRIRSFASFIFSVLTLRNPSSAMAIATARLGGTGLRCPTDSRATAEQFKLVTMLLRGLDRRAHISAFGGGK